LRPSKKAYLMKIAYIVAERGTCDRKKVGCVIATADGHILSTGYNGSPSGMPHCDDVGHEMFNGHCVRTVHAEQNAIGQAAKLGISIAGSVAYTTIHPCMTCSKLLASSGVIKVVYDGAYRKWDTLSEDVAGIIFEKFSEG